MQCHFFWLMNPWLHCASTSETKVSWIFVSQKFSTPHPGAPRFPPCSPLSMLQLCCVLTCGPGRMRTPVESKWTNEINLNVLSVLEGNVAIYKQPVSQFRKFENIYVGWGLKYAGGGYSPPAPPLPQKEYPSGPEITEALDPSLEEEQALKEALEEQEAAQEEMEDTDEEEEEDDDWGNSCTFSICLSFKYLFVSQRPNKSVYSATWLHTAEHCLGWLFSSIIVWCDIYEYDIVSNRLRACGIT